jgi:hypothetical protein
MNVLTILNELAASAGQDAVAAACNQFLNPKGKKAPKKERKPRGKSSWNLEVDKVLAELRQGLSEEDAKKKVTYKMAYAEASRRRRENNPEAQAKYEANQAKRGKKAASAIAEAVKAPESMADVLDYGDTPPDTDEDEQGVAVDGVPETYDAAQVYRFLFDLQDSGRINMLACPSELRARFGMTRQESEDILSEYMSRYEELKAKYQPKVESKVEPKTPQRRTSTSVLAPSAPKKALPVSRTKIPIA